MSKNKNITITEKICLSCKIKKDVSNFSLDHGYVKSRCKPCITLKYYKKKKSKNKITLNIERNGKTKEEYNKEYYRVYNKLYYKKMKEAAKLYEKLLEKNIDL